MKTAALFLGLLIAASIAEAATTATSGDTSTAFAEHGVIVDMSRFFHAAVEDGQTAAEPNGIAGRALATADGLYSFLETPENAEKLGDLEPGTVVHITGKLLRRGALLHVAELNRSSTISLDLDLAGLRSDPGLQITLVGTNKCQCGLDVADLPHSCKLGHLHHLEVENGMLYHYLPDPEGIALFLGQGSHFKEVAIEGRLFPGNYIKVETAKLP